ncbi:MAG: aminoacyl-histidine dipeptidase [Spirochaetia bacterium]
MQTSTDRILAIFERINAIPRCSSKERALSDWLVGWASEHQLECERDGALNVLIRVPGTSEAADAAPVALQGHLDMVCEKTPDSGHNFDTDPIRTVTEGEWLTASGTTLGADNGIAVALALAVAEDEEVVHPPLELLFTVDEESGLAGAGKLNPDWLRARTLLNLDSEDEGVFTIGCAGGLNSLISVPVGRVAPDSDLEFVQLTVSGLKGGHSGIDIHLDRANANVLVVRVAGDLKEKLGATVAEVDGGSAHNAIPRDSRIVLGFKPSSIEEARALVSTWHRTLSGEYGSTDPNLTVELREAQRPERVLDDASAGKIIDLLMGLPHGVVRMSREIADLVETSTNLATVRTSRGKVEIDTSQRSSSESELEAIAARVEAVARLGGGSVKITSRYTGWEPKTESRILRTASAVYRELFNAEPTVEVVHAGIECGVIGAKYPGMEMLSIGPTIQMPHSPDERMHLPSLERLWKFLVHLLPALR